ncbi:type IV pilus assembly protein PilM [Candidatus Aerophobetes bacterium]|nr:type IV pilus assembly protein PilM [Candidatus Aerophobetes bacterium]
MAKMSVGFKIGSTSLKFAEIAHAKEKYRLRKLGVENFPFSEKEQRYLNNISFLAEKIKEIIRTHNLNPRRIISGVEGESVVVRVIRVPYMKESELREAIKWEAEEHLPYPMEGISLDYHILKKDLLGSQGKEMSVLLVGVKRETIDEHLQIFQQAGLRPAIIDVNSLALYNIFGNINKGKTEGIALLNIGHSLTHLLVLSEDYPFLVRDIKFGGDDVARSLMQAFNITYIQAENLKKEGSFTGISKQLNREIGEEEVESIIRTSLSELVKEVVRSFEYFTSNKGGSPVQKVILSGGCSLIKDIDSLLSQELEVPVEMMDPFVNINYQKTKFENFLPLLSSVFAVPVGLALRKVSHYD